MDITTDRLEEENKPVLTFNKVKSEDIEMDIFATEVMNYALFHNNVKCVSAVSVLNKSYETVSNLELKITAEPEFAFSYVEKFPPIESGERVIVKNLDIKLDFSYFKSLTESENGRLKFTLFHKGNVIAEEFWDIRLLAFNEWPGDLILPEILASFVMPNNPACIKVAKRASEFLKEWTGDGALSDYQTEDCEYVKNQAAAVFKAFQELNINYTNPPASFEEQGQKVRFVDDVISERMGTCLDLSVAYASVLENIGLNPILILVRGHAFVGLWLTDDVFPDVDVDDSSMITKRLPSGLNEMIVIECTKLACDGSFDEAMKEGERRLRGFQYAIDVKRARASGIKPLPQGKLLDGKWIPEVENRDSEQLTEAPKEFQAIQLTEDDLKDDSPFDKMKLWERKLLDVGTRNPLVCMKLSKTVVPLLVSDIHALEDKISDGDDFTICPKPEDWPIPSDKLHFENMHLMFDKKELIELDFKSGRLSSSLTSKELQKSLTEIFRSSKTAMEESGVSNTYMVIGILRWFESEKSKSSKYAPLLMIPIEIIRKSSASGYIIRMRDDEPMINETILEKIKQDFNISVGGLNPLPLDDHGTDTRKIFAIIKNAVKDMKEWDILESAYIGVFSFSAFMMWNDLRNRSSVIASNKVVSSLMKGTIQWDPIDFNDDNGEEDTLIPMPADNSQIKAIRLADKGESFVLEGPPGTGKSQTITAMIANLLAHGKTVLFAAEKMAALEVVKKRLDKLGIGPFCLELHSNKANKKDLFEKLKKASEVVKGDESFYNKKLHNIDEARKELDAYASALHKKQPCGYSLFELADRCAKYSSAPSLPYGSIKNADLLSSEKISSHEKLISEIAAAGVAVGQLSDNPLRGIEFLTYSMSMKASLPALMKSYEKSLTALKEASIEFARVSGLKEASSKSDFSYYNTVAEKLYAWNDLPREWAVHDNHHRYIANVSEACKSFIKSGNMRAELSKKWEDDFFILNGEQLVGDIKKAELDWFLPKFFKKMQISGKLKKLAKGDYSESSILTDAQALRDFQKEKERGDSYLSKCGEDVDSFVEITGGDWNALLSMSKIAKDNIDGIDSAVLKKCGGDKSLKRILENMIESYASFMKSHGDIENICKIYPDNEGMGWIDKQLEGAYKIEKNIDSVKDWAAWNRIASEADKEGIYCIADAYICGASGEQLLGIYRKSLYNTIAMKAVDESPALSAFSGIVFNGRIERFKMLDKEREALAKKEIYYRLSSKVPNFSREASKSSEVGILQKAIRSNGRGMGIRTLFSKIPNLLPRLCPCMLMSPMSAAQYLDPECPPFDVVIFDEASQIQTCKAVGVIARAKNAIVVGDSKQMPPTTFFASSAVDEDNIVNDDMDSLLEDCLALPMPSKSLLWHYRSRHESLIAFSNSKFYDNTLLTFPSADDIEEKVRFVKVNGCFEKNGARRNPVEAEAVVQDIVRRCHDKRLSKFSVGVVTFNTQQQELIDDMLSEACQNDPELEKWAYESQEPLFIKNLENVQGDERDVILFSIGYGPDKNGFISMNFGPLNRDGGWKRLNVAVSRARNEMTVFSSLAPEDIDLKRTQAEGVVALKNFLEYASGKRMTSIEKTVTADLPEPTIEATLIKDFLESKGYKCSLDVGRSKYRVDIGVMNPSKKGKYMLGILLDGKSYACSESTRDRELSQISVLKGLGWKLIRIWTMDWLDSPEKEKKRILDVLEDLKRNPPEEDTVEYEYSPNISFSSNIAKKNEKNKELTYKASIFDSGKIPADYFVLNGYDKALKERITDVIKNEGPISEGLLIKRVVKSFGIARITPKIKQKMISLLRLMELKKTIQDEGSTKENTFYWKSTQDPTSYEEFRKNGTEDSKRDADDICFEESCNASITTLENQLSLPKEELVKETAKLFGFTRTSESLEYVINNGIEIGMKKGKIKEDNKGFLVLS